MRKFRITIPALVVITGILMSGCAILGKKEGKPSDKVSDKVFYLVAKNRMGGDLRYVVKEVNGWENDLNKRVHPHLVAVRTRGEGGPGWISHRWVEFTKLNPGTVLWNCRNAKNNFIYCNVALEYLGDYGRNAVEVAALRSIVQGYTHDDSHPVIRAYFYLSPMLEETRLDIKSAGFPYLSNAERNDSEKKSYIKSLDKSPHSVGRPVIQKMKTGEEKKDDDQTSF